VLLGMHSSSLMKETILENMRRITFLAIRAILLRPHKARHEQKGPVTNYLQ
jgi:hypothetical protein